MSGRERIAQAGPSNPSRQPKPATSWSLSLFGGRQTKPSSNPSGLGWSRPGASSSARHRDERESLLPSPSADDFDDSDAISLLSNIADRDSRRGGSGSAAARRRARARARAQGRTCGTFWLDVEEWIPALSCGLLGRTSTSEGEGRRQRAASIGSVMSRGRRSQADEEAVAALTHQRSVSDASLDSIAGSLAGSGFAESVDDDAGMLDDVDIARFGQPIATHQHDHESPAQSQAAAEDEALLKAEAEAAEANAQAERQRALEAEAARLQQEAEAEAQRQKDEEARLAAEEEAAIAKARRKAERKAAKAGLLKLQQENKAAQGWRTEAEAEAAAGGFGLADAEEDESYDHDAAEEHFDYQDADEEMHGGEYEQYGDAEEGADGYYATVQEQGPAGVVVHHHYYHATPPAEEEEEVFVYQPSLPAQQDRSPVKEVVEEDEPDIAGLSFGRKASRSRHHDSSAGSRSGSGLTPRGLPSSSSSNSITRPTYRDRPRRGSKSSNSSSGIFSYQSSNALHPNAPSTVATSVTSPLGRESEEVYTPAAGLEGTKGGAAHEVEGAQFGKADVDANEFGVITAGSDRGGAGRVKKSWREKRARSQVVPDEDGERFEGFPGF